MKTPRRTPFATSLALVALTMMTASLGCAAVVGADDYQVGVAENAAGTSNGQGGSLAGVGGSDSMGGGDTGGSRPGTGGSLENRRDASPPSEDAEAPMKPETSVTPPKNDAAKPDVLVPDTGTGGKPVGSGETICTTSCTGAGLTCQHTALGTSGICTYLCNDVSECDATHDCIGSGNAASNFDYACVRKCAANNPCPNLMSCVPLSSGSVCLPTDWLPHDLGLGDDCLQDEQCTSGQCLNKPNGWCSRPCHAFDTDFDYCDGDYAGQNYYSEYNSCIKVAGAYKCTPGCTNDSTVCTNYPGTTCKSVVDIDGLDETVCTP